MDLQPGSKLGPYEIVSAIGRGGMGEVWKARDPRLNRDVAIKTSRAEFSGRFQKEAQVIAALNHPNICTLHDVGPDYLVMEFIEGPTLAERIKEGPIALEEALGIAKQIGDALEAAHDKSIVHRDLKPANIKIRPDGSVKVLDFGLARAGEPQEVTGDSPTLMTAGTQEGMILGTAGYMSPEQARGRAVDKRADIWAFGVVLYEMLTAKRLFEGETVSDSLAAILKEEPDLTQTPEKTRRLLQRCLEKDPKKRLRGIADWQELLDSQEALTAPSRWHFGGSGWVVAGALAAGLAVLGFLYFGQARPAAVVLNLRLEGKTSTMTDAVSSFPVVSPDGRSIAFRPDGALWVRNLGSPDPRKLAEIDESGPFRQVFWSPDSRSIGYFSAGKLMKIAAAGGPTQVICTLSEFRGGSWNGQETIIVANREGVWRVPAAGGTAILLLETDKSANEDSYISPWFLPDGRHFLYTANRGERSASAVFTGDLNSKDRKRVLSVPTNAVYVSPGHLLFVQNRTLMAQPFDVRQMRVTGIATPLAGNLAYNLVTAIAAFSVSGNGVLLYRTGDDSALTQLTWLDRSGMVLGTVGEPANLENISLAADDSSVVSVRGDRGTGNFDLWKHDLVRHTDSRLTFTGNNRFPALSPDGTQIAFDSSRDGARKVYRKAANGTGKEEVLEASVKLPVDWSRDGRYLLASTPVQTPATGNDIWILPLFGDRKPIPYLVTRFAEGGPRLSPDGQWLAYHSNESGRQEVYVMSFPEPGGKGRVSSSGGQRPVWSRDGKELYFVSADDQMMATGFRPGATFEAGIPKPLFKVRMARGNFNFQVSGDGRFLVPVQMEQAEASILVVLNWPALLKK